MPKDSGETSSEYPNLIKASHKLVKAKVRKDFGFFAPYFGALYVPTTSYFPETRQKTRKSPEEIFSRQVRLVRGAAAGREGKGQVIKDPIDN